MKYLMYATNPPVYKYLAIMPFDSHTLVQNDTTPTNQILPMT